MRVIYRSRPEHVVNVHGRTRVTGVGMSSRIGLENMFL